jgi:glycine cleavage system H protein
MQDNIKFMDHMWLSIDDGIVTVGVLEEAAEDLSDEINLSLPEEDDIVMKGKICGFIETESGNINLYSPVSGTVVEINEMVTENPELIVEDPTDEGWLFRVEAEDTTQLEKYSRGAALVSSDDEDEDEDEDDDSDEDYEDSESLESDDES